MSFAATGWALAAAIRVCDSVNGLGGSLTNPCLGGGSTPAKPKPVFTTPYIEQLSGNHGSLLRCISDQIISKESARQRIDWAYACHLLDRETYELEFTHAWNRQTKTWEPLPSESLRYPIFVHLDAARTYPAWTPNLGSCSVPADVTFYDICLNGCYRGDQRLAFQDGYAAIAEAAGRAARPEVLIVDRLHSSLEFPVFTSQPIDYFIQSAADAPETLLELKTESGALVVTREHPLVNAEGYLQLADGFQVGDALVRANGAQEPILSKDSLDFFGKVYNLAPMSFDPTENIIIAEGYLNGSHRFQDGALADFREAALKRHFLLK